MANDEKEKLEKIKRLIDRMKKLAENIIDETPKRYYDDAQYLYSVTSSFVQKIDLDAIDDQKEADEDEQLSMRERLNKNETTS